MSDIDKDPLDHQFDRLARQLPRSVAGFLHWLREPSSKWVRWPAAILLILGGFVGFLPILGFWMVPVGLILLAQDIPFLRPPIARAISWVQHQWIKWKWRRLRK